jgi:hypothetical protein
VGGKDYRIFSVGPKQYLAIEFLSPELEVEIPRLSGRVSHRHWATPELRVRKRPDERIVHMEAKRIRKFILPPLPTGFSEIGPLGSVLESVADRVSPCGWNGLESHERRLGCCSCIFKRYQLIPSVKHDFS